ncbi:hypothetical protein PVAND_009104 [Polypedilum vanderplanki]|uniref:Uncharacterized protein n=1 Tax=Polypedilum vanderplanki TaxID=319348 RepID=A0A9J6CCG5_POLVA|nr:hypothetical protein PVAND_009104 [Polypedilum vanderplanki]
MENTLLITEENENTETKETEDENPVKLKVAMANKRLKEEFFRENEINMTTETMNEEYENQIDQSIMDMENIGHTYNSSDSEDDDDEENILNDDDMKMRATYGQQVPPILMPFYERRRLSECKEESETDDENEDEKTIKPTIIITTTNGTAQQVPISDDVSQTTTTATTRRFVVTKTKEEEIQISPAITSSLVKQPVSILKKSPSPPSYQKSLNMSHSPKNVRYEANALKFVPAEKNSHTIHFPCSNDRANVKNFFSPQGILSPRIDKRFFDTSLVEIRTSQNQLANSTKSLDDGGSCQPNSDIWIKRNDSKKSNIVDDKISISSSDSNSITENNRSRVDDTDGSSSTRPQSAPATQQYKKSKKYDKEAKKERQRIEKDAIKFKKEAAKREKEAAKLEKLSKSNERLGGRSGSLERRKSGEDSVINQFTIHGIASPNKRPTLFDVFRRKDSKKDKEISKTGAAISSDKDSVSSGSGGGIMNSMKAAIYSGKTTSVEAPEIKSKKVRDGSAHPHGNVGTGSDARYYHTVTAVRRADQSRSPMLKVMDLFRHRSNSAVSEADKRKARAAQQHQQQLAAQSEYLIFYIKCNKKWLNSYKIFRQNHIKKLSIK